MEIFIHIGSNKTGTSAIQAFLHRNPEYLESINAVYPLAGRNGGPDHHSLALCMSAQKIKDTISDIKQEAQDLGRERIILSSEAFHTVDPSPFIQGFAGHKITTVAFVRDHASYLSSWYREGVKANARTMSFTDFVFNMNTPYYEWARRWPNLKIIKYDRSSLINQSVVDQFAMTIDPTSNLSNISLSYDENPSISGNLLFAKQIFNNVITLEQEAPVHREMFFLAAADPTFSGAMFIPEHLQSFINDKYEYDRHTMLDTYGIDLTPKDSYSEGHLTPNPETFASDLNKIITFSQEHNLTFGPNLSGLLFVQNS